MFSYFFGKFSFNFSKKGEQDILVNIADVLPTIAEIAGVKIPNDYEINGESFWPYLTTNKKSHRDWIYAYKGKNQLIRGSKVLKDGNGTWLYLFLSSINSISPFWLL